MKLHMGTIARIHWMRALTGGFLAEVALRDSDSRIQGIRPACLTLRRAASGYGDVFLVRSLGRAEACIALHLARRSGSTSPQPYVIVGESVGQLREVHQLAIRPLGFYLSSACDIPEAPVTPIGRRRAG